MHAALVILAVQALFGALDNLLHHELQARLPSRRSARRELAWHAQREAIYGVLFLALAWAEWHGLWAMFLAVLLLVEVGITLADFLEEDASRRLPRFERVLHTILAVGYGIFLAALAPSLFDWADRPSAIVAVDHGWLSWLLTLYAPCVLAWSLRNAVAVARLKHLPAIPIAEPNGRTVLLTGGTGFIGSALLPALAAEGYRLLLLTRDARAAKACFGAEVLPIEDLADLPSETRIDAVINLAGAPIFGLPWTARRRRLLRDSRLAVTRQVIALIERLETRPEVLISASAIGYYGTGGDEPIDEGGAAQPIFQSELCGAWEAEACRAGDVGVRVVLLRLGIVLGRDGGIFAPLALAARCGLGAVLGDGRQMISWIHRDDAIGLVRRALTDDRLAGPVNATALEPVTQAAFAARLAAALRRPLWLRVPAAPLRLALGEMAQLLLEGRRVLPIRALEAGFRFAYPKLDAALAELVGKPAVSAAGSRRTPPRTSPA